MADDSNKKPSWVSRVTAPFTGSTALTAYAAAGGALAAGAAAHWFFGLSSDDISNLIQQDHIKDLVHHVTGSDTSIIVHTGKDVVEIVGSSGAPTVQDILTQLSNANTDGKFDAVIAEINKHAAAAATAPMTTAEAVKAISDISGVHVLDLKSLPEGLQLITSQGTDPQSYLLNVTKAGDLIFPKDNLQSLLSHAVNNDANGFNNQVQALLDHASTDQTATKPQIDGLKALLDAPAGEKLNALLSVNGVKDAVTAVGAPGADLNVVQLGDKLMGVSNSEQLTSALQSHNDGGRFNEILAKVNPPAPPAVDAVLDKIDKVNGVSIGTMNNLPEGLTKMELPPAVPGGPEQHKVIDVNGLDTLAREHPDTWGQWFESWKSGANGSQIGESARALANQVQGVRGTDVAAAVIGGGAAGLAVRGVNQESNRRAVQALHEAPDFWRARFAEEMAASQQQPPQSPVRG